MIGKQCRPWSRRLIWVYTVCSGPSVSIFRVITICRFSVILFKGEKFCDFHQTISGNGLNRTRIYSLCKRKSLLFCSKFFLSVVRELKPFWQSCPSESKSILLVTVEKMEITFFPDRGSNPVRWTQSPTLYRVAIKAGLYRKAVQVWYIPIPGDILRLQIKICPWISRSPRITWYEARGVLCTHAGYLRWAPNVKLVTVEKMEITFFPDRGSNTTAGLKVLHYTASL